jgi:hypothetical protein
MKKVSFVCSLLLIGALSSCFPIQKNQYHAVVTQNFINLCEESGGDQKYCSCIIEKIQEKYTEEEFSTIEAQLRYEEANYELEAHSEFLTFMDKVRVQCNN